VRSIERWRAGGDACEDQRRGPRTVPHNKLSEHEACRLVRELTSPEHRDLSPRQVIPALAERGVYIASEATAYRVLRHHNMQHHRQSTRVAQHRRPDELIATAPNQVFCWDITYLKTEVTGRYFYLYMVTDIYSHSIVAARVHMAECEKAAAELFRDVQRSEGIAPGQAVLHSDNGSAMKGATLKATLEKLGVAQSFSRPRVSDDNPFIESLFGTMKTRVGYPRRGFPSIEDAQAWVDRFTHWYNYEHRHSALNWVTPMARHLGHDVRLLQRRRATYQAARARNPGRWSGNIRDCNPAPAVTLNPSKARSHVAHSA
jgi:putative transposase